MGKKNFLKFFRNGLTVFLFCIQLLTLPALALDLDKLSEADIQMVKQVISKLEPLIQERDSAGTLATLTFKELDGPLSKKERKFLKQFRHLSRKETGTKVPWRGLSTGATDLIEIKGQKVKDTVKVRKEGKVETKVVSRTLPPQFLPRPIFQKYTEMMDSMEKDTGMRLYVDSGYRSSAFQLYLFVYYLRNHNYSVRETVKYVTLPGYSEHGCPRYQAIDFINAEGINGDPHVEEFEKLPENEWLLKNAHRFGFVLSYPKDSPNPYQFSRSGNWGSLGYRQSKKNQSQDSPSGITYEPWHWRFDPKAVKHRNK